MRPTAKLVGKFCFKDFQNLFLTLKHSQLYRCVYAAQVCVCVGGRGVGAVWVWVWCGCGCARALLPGDLKKVSGLQLELQVVVSYQIWVLGTKLGSCGRAASVLNCHAISSLPLVPGFY